MISGVVAEGYATIPITFRLENQPDFAIKFIIDTGFTDYLCLPPEAVIVLGLPFLYDFSANLANNTDVILPVHQGIIIWQGEEKVVRVLATGRRPLVGTALLNSHTLTINFIEGGAVKIEPIE